MDPELQDKVKSILDEYLTDEQLKETIFIRLVDVITQEWWSKFELVPIPIEKLREILL